MRLTARQSAIVRLVADGRCDKEIAAALHISVATARTHLRRLYDREGIHTRAQAVLLLSTAETRDGKPEPLHS